MYFQDYSLEVIKLESDMGLSLFHQAKTKKIYHYEIGDT